MTQSQTGPACFIRIFVIVFIVLACTHDVTTGRDLVGQQRKRYAPTAHRHETLRFTLADDGATVLTLTPALVRFDWARVEAIASRLGTLPLPVQVLTMVLVADLTQYWVHRTFHVVPWLWPFHAIHHSVEDMDWLAGSRLHLVDVILTRGLTYVPIFVLGFSRPALLVYVFLVAAQATFIHANVRWTFRPLRRLVATPAFHHWHHSSEQEVLDRNFAVHTPLWDILFGTYYLPDHWPARYGLNNDRHLPVGWLRQSLHPFRRSGLRRL